MRPALLLGVLALVLAACGGDARPAAPSTPGSTLRATLVDADGDGFLERGPGEPLVDRGTAAEPGRTLATFAQLTDTHVRDEESPARVPFLDRTGGPFTSTFRPQEAFSTQTLDAAVRAVNREKPQAVFVTGDITDNAQRNELTMALDTLNGKTVDPDSGAKGYDGVQDADSADPFYYRPDHDAPTHAGAIEQAQKPFKAAGPEGALVPARRQPRRARPGRGPAHARDRRVRHRRPARPQPGPEPAPAHARGRRQAGRRRRSSRGRSHSTRSTRRPTRTAS